MPKPLLYRVKTFDKDGYLTATGDYGDPSPFVPNVVRRSLELVRVSAVEVHYEDGTSKEFSLIAAFSDTGAYR